MYTVGHVQPYPALPVHKGKAVVPEYSVQVNETTDTVSGTDEVFRMWLWYQKAANTQLWKYSHSRIWLHYQVLGMNRLLSHLFLGLARSV